MNLESVNESGKYERKYSCPFCDVRLPKRDLVLHIDDEHEEMIPKNYTAARLVFNIANKKEYGTCVECKKQSPWNENAWRYDRFCSNKCRNVYKEKVNKRMLKVHGVEKLTDSTEHQKKMLMGRRISGEYKFSDGNIRTYTGSYEKNLLEIFDNFYNIHSKDIETPGPVIEYIYKGKVHKWITDVYYTPYNLVFDVKDGGSNKNTHPDMKEYRDKQIAKEKAIKKLGTYNYIRLTDNDFGQLFNIMSELKHNMNNNINKSVIHINEEALFDNIESSVIGDIVYLIPYSKNNIGIEGLAFSKDLTLDDIFILDSSTLKIKKVNKEALKEYHYSIIEVSTNKSKEIYKQILLDVKENKDIANLKYFLDLIKEEDGSIEECLLLNNDYVVIESGSDLSKFDFITCIQELTKFSPDTIAIPLIESEQKQLASVLLKEYSNLNIYNSPDGYFICNEFSRTTSKHFENINDIDKKTLNLISRGY